MLSFQNFKSSLKLGEAASSSSSTDSEDTVQDEENVLDNEKDHDLQRKKSSTVRSTHFCTEIQCPLKKHHLSTLGLTFQDVLDCKKNREEIEQKLYLAMKERTEMLGQSSSTTKTLKERNIYGAYEYLMKSNLEDISTHDYIRRRTQQPRSMNRGAIYGGAWGAFHPPDVDQRIIKKGLFLPLFGLSIAAS